MTDTLHNPAEIAGRILNSGVYESFWDRPQSEWPVSEQGQICPVYCNLRSLIGDVSMRNYLADQMTLALTEALVIEESDVVLAGLATAGIPWATLVGDRLDLPTAYIRKSNKQYGGKSGYEGLLGAGQQVVYIDDVVLTGETLLASSEQMSSVGVSSISAGTLLRLSDVDAKAQQPNGDIEPLDLFFLSDYDSLVDAAIESGMMSDDQGDRVKSYYANPTIQPW